MAVLLAYFHGQVVKSIPKPSRSLYNQLTHAAFSLMSLRITFNLAVATKPAPFLRFAHSSNDSSFQVPRFKA